MDTAIAELIALVLMVTIVGVLLVTIPITRRLGRVMEEWIRIRAEGAADQVSVDRMSEEIRALGRHVEALDDRLQLLAERQDFTESLVDGAASRKAIPTDPS